MVEHTSSQSHATQLANDLVRKAHDLVKNAVTLNEQEKPVSDEAVAARIERIKRSLKLQQEVLASLMPNADYFKKRITEVLTANSQNEANIHLQLGALTIISGRILGELTDSPLADHPSLQLSPQDNAALKQGDMSAWQRLAENLSALSQERNAETQAELTRTHVDIQQAKRETAPLRIASFDEILVDQLTPFQSKFNRLVTAELGGAEQKEEAFSIRFEDIIKLVFKEVPVLDTDRGQSPQVFFENHRAEINAVLQQAYQQEFNRFLTELKSSDSRLVEEYTGLRKRLPSAQAFSEAIRLNQEQGQVHQELRKSLFDQLTELELQGYADQAGYEYRPLVGEMVQIVDQLPSAEIVSTFFQEVARKIDQCQNGEEADRIENMRKFGTWLQEKIDNSENEKSRAFFAKAVKSVSGNNDIVDQLQVVFRGDQIDSQAFDGLADELTNRNRLNRLTEQLDQLHQTALNATQQVQEYDQQLAALRDAVNLFTRDPQGRIALQVAADLASEQSDPFQFLSQQVEVLLESNKEFAARALPKLADFFEKLEQKVPAITQLEAGREATYQKLEEEFNRQFGQDVQHDYVADLQAGLDRMLQLQQLQGQAHELEMKLASDPAQVALVHAKEAGVISLSIQNLRTQANEKRAAVQSDLSRYQKPLSSVRDRDAINTALQVEIINQLNQVKPDITPDQVIAAIEAEIAQTQQLIAEQTSRVTKIENYQQVSKKADQVIDVHRKELDVNTQKQAEASLNHSVTELTAQADQVTAQLNALTLEPVLWSVSSADLKQQQAFLAQTLATIREKAERVATTYPETAAAWQNLTPEQRTKFASQKVDLDRIDRATGLYPQLIVGKENALKAAVSEKEKLFTDVLVASSFAELSQVMSEHKQELTKLASFLGLNEAMEVYLKNFQNAVQNLGPSWTRQIDQASMTASVPLFLAEKMKSLAADHVMKEKQQRQDMIHDLATVEFSTPEAAVLYLQRIGWQPVEGAITGMELAQKTGEFFRGLVFQEGKDTADQLFAQAGFPDITVVRNKLKKFIIISPAWRSIAEISAGKVETAEQLIQHLRQIGSRHIDQRTGKTAAETATQLQTLLDHWQDPGVGYLEPSKVGNLLQRFGVTRPQTRSPDELDALLQQYGINDPEYKIAETMKRVLVAKYKDGVELAPQSAKVEVIPNEYLRSEFKLNRSKNTITIGRNDLGNKVINDLPIFDPESKVSRQHALITLGENNQIEVSDLHSTNGTFVNNERVTGNRILYPGDKIRLGTAVELIVDLKRNPRTNEVQVSLGRSP